MYQYSTSQFNNIVYSINNIDLLLKHIRQDFKLTAHVYNYIIPASITDKNYYNYFQKKGYNYEANKHTIKLTLISFLLLNKSKIFAENALFTLTLVNNCLYLIIENDKYKFVLNRSKYNANSTYFDIYFNNLYVNNICIFELQNKVPIEAVRYLKLLSFIND